MQLKKRVKRRCEVLRVEKGPDGAFDVRVRSRKADGAEREETLRSRFVVWAAGELEYRARGGRVEDTSVTCPRHAYRRVPVPARRRRLRGRGGALPAQFAGALCLRTGREARVTQRLNDSPQVSSWASLDGDERVVIGGYESGVDAAVNLAKAGKQATVLASTATRDSTHDC